MRKPNKEGDGDDAVVRSEEGDDGPTAFSNISFAKWVDWKSSSFRVLCSSGDGHSMPKQMQIVLQSKHEVEVPSSTS
ncbi:putative serine carboxypeptidase [Corchorus olitorius]|uniref:Serine carboxypeptidase n=1 Tax=Corchorus olitorius TaxID=93759 RepID=A0A1R3H2T4_9ROSI|nr:putative serine carboxypeptidase [Corchorus olitorius]